MAQVTRFPHYHQTENVVTNHVMVMLRMLYEASPKLLEALLRALCAEEVTVGPRFSQQIHGAHSVPDGLIAQDPLAVFVETKLGSLPNPGQLARHCQTIVDRLPGRKGSFLLSLTAGQAGLALPGEVTDMAAAHGVTVVPVTFGELVDQLAELPGADLVLRATLQEFADFIFAQGLVPRQSQIMVAMLTGISWRENLAHGVYYEPIDRSPKHARAAFLGLYHDKQVSHVGRIVTAVGAMHDDTGEMIFDKPESGKLDDAGRQAIRDVVAAAQAYYPGLEASRHRYYVVDGFAPTNFRKVSGGGMMGHRYFDIESMGGRRLPERATGTLAAGALDGLTYL
ncbi:hypothetical protein [Methylobacterium sp. J-092]|uniref:hypothetical protein n=1 Tax=Methylobacterium sp. J-092 TaxID=2836667 RepID=UPI001FB8E81E|nr:hypothetical protein [Methylobacterium sp. J-092]MCJ2007485.1 hypothetical protein [Methylobacterium sp. J-092]